MSTWFKLLPMELQDIREQQFIDSTSEVRKTDKVLGKLNDEHKALYTLMQRLRQARDLEGVAAKYEQDLAKLVDRHERLHELGDKAAVVRSLLWAAVCEDLKIWSTAYPAVRKGWTVVREKPPRQRGLPGFLGSMIEDHDEDDEDD